MTPLSNFDCESNSYKRRTHSTFRNKVNNKCACEFVERHEYSLNTSFLIHKCIFLGSARSVYYNSNIRQSVASIVRLDFVFIMNLSCSKETKLKIIYDAFINDCFDEWMDVKCMHE